ncbi:hypothetical protein FOCC_FOCC013030, partial [Frankliniella occidentalis]
RRPARTPLYPPPGCRSRAPTTPAPSPRSANPRVIHTTSASSPSLEYTSPAPPPPPPHAPERREHATNMKRASSLAHSLAPSRSPSVMSFLSSRTSRSTSATAPGPSPGQGATTAASRRPPTVSTGLGQRAGLRRTLRISKRLTRRRQPLPKGQNGFEELRRYVKQGGDFCKDLTSILQERSEAEQVYAKSLAKLSAKLLKASKDAVGTVGQAWQRVGTEMECQGEIHRTFSVALSEEVVKPLKQLVDSQHRIRKSVESSVDKTAKSLSEWRQAEAKSKKSSFMCARDNEKLQDAMVEGRQSTRGSSLHLHHAVHNKMSDKDVAKLETKRRKAEDSVKKADVEYYTFCIRAERAR